MALKDNRLPPIGFSTTHEVYDTTLIIGNAEQDANFNKDDAGMEGNGTDVLRYHIPLNYYTGNLEVIASVYYQSLPPKWMQEMFGESTPEIDLFKSMFDSADQSPVLIASDTISDLFVMSVGTSQPTIADQIQLYPNPSLDQKVFLELPDNLKVRAVKIFTVDGKLVHSYSSLPEYFELPEANGVFIIQLDTEEGIVNKRWIKQ